jgi:hypothetical protein
MAHFSKQQLDEIGKHFGLKQMEPGKNQARLRDGAIITKGDIVWWRAEDGPCQANSNDESHWANICRYPHSYQTTMPITTVSYPDRDKRDDN